MATAQPMLVTTPDSEGDPGDTEAFTRYLTEIGRYPLLTADEELALGQRAQSGDASARQQLVVCNLRLVVHLAKDFHARELTLLDLVQEGTLGLMRAAEKYQPRPNVRFATYARYWIRQAIGKALIERDHAMPLPEDVYYDQQRIRRVTAQLSVALGRTPTAEETARAMGVSVQRLARLATMPARQIASLDAPLFSDGEHASDETVLGDFLTDDTDGASSVEEQAEQRDEQTRLYALLRKHLTPREVAVVALRYLTVRAGREGKSPTPGNTSSNNNNKPLAYYHVAAKLNISGELARLIEGEALAKLRKALILTPDGVMPRRTRRRVRRRA